jgi:hypothetical protein
MKYVLPSILLVIVFLVLSCNDDTTVEPPTPQMTILDAPAALLANADTCYLYRVRLFNTGADSISVEVRGPDNQVHSTFALYDDGGDGDSTGPAYACPGSGDIVPSDSIFSRRINGQELANGVTGIYQFTFRAPNVSDEVREVTIQNAEPCIITAYPQTQNFETCFTPMTLEVRVARTEGDAVDTVRMQLITLEVPQVMSELDFVPFSGDTVWHAQLTPHFFECTGAEAYEIVYSAMTRFGMECQQEVMPVTYSNSLPVLSNSTLPDTIFRPTVVGDTDTVIVTVNMQDCELHGERFYYGLRFDVRRDTDPWPPISPDDYFLRDDGVPPDLVPGNGFYTVGLTFIRSEEHLDNEYYFRFYAIECAAPYDTSAYLMDSVRVIQPLGVLVKGEAGRIGDERDFGVVK